MTWADLPPLNSLIPFEATIRLGSLTRAAEELRVTHGAVSRHLQALERAANTTLFVRKGRVLVPTETALTLHAKVQDALMLLTSAVQQARPSTERGPLVLSCEPTLMMRWLLPRLPSLTAAHPELPLHLSAAGGPVTLHRTGIDVAIRRTDFDISDALSVTALFPEWVGPVCTPELAAAFADPRQLLNEVPRLVAATRPSAWGTWAKHAEIDLPSSPELNFEHFYLSLEAATAGLGVAIGPYALVRTDLETNRLVAPFGFIADGTSYVLLSSTTDNDARIDTLRTWLLGYRTESQPPIEIRTLSRVK